MGRQRGPWHDGHRAWARLLAWLGTTTTAGQARADAGEKALDAMADIGAIRRLLDQAELVAVRTARRHRKSWAEIATQLGITRQSAWERWRELDDDTPVERIAASAEATTHAVVDDEMLTELANREVSERRRRGKVVVPNVVGMPWDDASTELAKRGLHAVNHDPGPEALAALGWPNTIVTDQIPEAGAKVESGTHVQLWLERGGGSAGDREPRRPSPAPKSGYEWREEPTDEAVG